MGFKVIIVGGGPVGLVAAHALHLAGIDFTVLERRDSVVDPSGASVVLSPPSMRILSQFGLKEAVEEAGAELSHVKSFTREGYKFRDSTQVALLKECLGAAQVIYHRPELVKIMYEGLPPEAKKKVLTQKKVVKIDQDKETVLVSCADGSSYSGNIVIGADGVHSRTREQLRQAMIRAGQEAECDDLQPYEATYRMLWCTIDRPDSTPPGLGGETQDTNRTLALMVGKESAMIICYEKLEKPTRERVDYSEKDMAQFADAFADYPVSETLKFKDVYGNNTSAGMANLAEGIVKNFSQGRIVLVGDSCHRFTPNAGLGLNNGIQDVVAICNGLHETVKESKDGNPSQAAVDRLFSRYCVERIPFMKKDLRSSALLTRLQAWASTWFYICSRFLLVPDWFQRFTIRYVAVPTMRLAPVLKYASVDEPYVGTTAWAHPIGQKSEK
ncbi:hypothetical protein EV127DRAFT_393552 [Xylaria flabelliformis]|nr:hypothetical protein EV127DRAFT_393552 [Xylaria flabelliformis]